MPQENGTARPIYFFLTPSYWGIRFHRKKPAIIERRGTNGTSGRDDDVREEERKTFGNEDDPNVAVRILNMSKV